MVVFARPTIVILKNWIWAERPSFYQKILTAHYYLGQFLWNQENKLKSTNPKWALKRSFISTLNSFLEYKITFKNMKLHNKDTNYLFFSKSLACGFALLALYINLSLALNYSSYVISGLSIYFYFFPRVSTFYYYLAISLLPISLMLSLPLTFSFGVYTVLVMLIVQISHFLLVKRYKNSS